MTIKITDGYFQELCGEGFASARLTTVFDAEVETPKLIDHLEINTPEIRDLMASLRVSLPVAPHSGVGKIGNSGFFRLPNHYRSVSFVVQRGAIRQGACGGVISFKGTEPLICDFPRYLDWMLTAPFRASSLPLGLHFPLELRLPPSAMWICECISEQRISSTIQSRYFEWYGRTARLPVPLFVFRMTREQCASYERIICDRLPEVAVQNVRSKIADGLGVEVYYYPELPVRVADLFVGGTKDAFKEALGAANVKMAFDRWIRLFSDMIGLGVMPYAPWHRGMGACVDQGNACIDGGFSDLLTLVSFDAIQNDQLFRSSLQSSIRLLAESMAAMAAASLGISLPVEADAVALIIDYVRGEMLKCIESIRCDGRAIDDRLLRILDRPEVEDIFNTFRATHEARRRQSQYIAEPQIPQLLMDVERSVPAGCV